MEKYLGRYRIPSSRHPDYDYSAPGMYYVTLCTKNREDFFGKIINGKMILNAIGKIAYNEWIKTPLIRPDMNIVLDEFCIMPNHFHGIIIFKDDFRKDALRYHRDALRYHRDALRCVSTKTFPIHSPNKFGPQSRNLASVIRGFKAAVKAYASRNNIEFSWQSRYYDHIIRNELDYYRIRNYIKENPVKWDKDE